MVRDAMAADVLVERPTQVSREFGLEACTVVIDGTGPVGRGMEPALDALAVVRVEPDAPVGLAERDCASG